MKNSSLSRAAAITGVLVLFVVMSRHVPAFGIKPGTDFVFQGGGDDCYQHRYSVKEGKIIDGNFKNRKKKPKTFCKDYRWSRLYYYDVEAKIARELSPQEAAKLTVDTSPVSPEGLKVVAGKPNFLETVLGSESLFFAQYLKKGMYNQKLNLGPPAYYEFKFIGWVK